MTANQNHNLALGQWTMVWSGNRFLQVFKHEIEKENESRILYTA